MALDQNFQWASHLANKFSNSLQPLPDAPMNIYERFSSAEGEWKIYDVWLMICFGENMWRVIDDLFWFFVVENICCVLDEFFSCRGWIKNIWCGIGDFWKHVFFFKIMMSFSLAEGELKIYDVGLMVRRLQRKKRNISQTPDKEIRKIWLEN